MFLFKSKQIDNIVNIPFNNIKIDIDNYDISITDLKKKLKVFDMDIYNNYFEDIIKERGERYYNRNKIKDYKKDNDTYNAIVIGEKEYKVSLVLDKDNIKDAKCTCPHFEKGNYCKHIYALLYKIKASGNKNKIKDAIYELNSAVKKMVEESRKYVDSHTFKDSVLDEYEAYIDSYSYNERFDNNDTLEHYLLLRLDNFIKKASLIRSNLKNTLANKNIDKIVENEKYIGKKRHSINVNITIERPTENKVDTSGILLYTLLHSKKKNKKENDLEDWQQELVDKGLYDETSFDESEELEEDDYYNEDD